MSKAERIGKMKTRESRRGRVPELGYYFIVTDTKETEQNYMYGLRNSIPQSVQNKLVIKVFKSDTVNLVQTALSLSANSPQYRKVWIIFDRDQVKDFDKIISEASENKIQVGWSNPCIEIWFHAYFGCMPSSLDSVACCNKFEDCFEKKAKQKYIKSDTDIYRKLCKYGDEKKAIEIASNKLKDIKDEKTNPSEMSPCTTIHELIDEIKSKCFVAD